MWAMLHVGGEYAGFGWGVFHLQSCGENSLLLHCSLMWGRMRYAPTLVCLKSCGENSLLLHCSLMWGRMRYAPTPVRLKSCVENLWLLLVRPREGVCDTPLHLFGWNHAVKIRGYCLFACVRAYAIRPYGFPFIYDVVKIMGGLCLFADTGLPSVC